MRFKVGDVIERKVMRGVHGKRQDSWDRCEVIEVVAVGAKPTRAGNWDFSVRDHESYVVQEEGYWTRVWHPGQTFWPRVKWLRSPA